MTKAVLLFALCAAGCTLIYGDAAGPSAAPPGTAPPGSMAPGPGSSTAPSGDLGVVFGDGASSSSSQCPGVDLSRDPRHCGTCNHDCVALAGVVASAVRCTAGVCDVSGACAPTRAHCSVNPDDGCETDLTQSTHCGACSMACAAPTPLCLGLTCTTTCAAPTPVECGGSCVDTLTDPHNCSACGLTCLAPANGSGSCRAGVCGVSSCNAGFHQCGNACRSDASTSSCGASCSPCPVPANGAAVCANRACDISCNAGFVRSGSTCVAGGGVAWQMQASGVTQALTGIWGSGSSNIYVVGAAGTILHSSGDGNWTPQTSNTTLNLFGIWGSGSGDIYVCGEQGTILHSAGNGSWASQTSMTTYDLYALWGSSALDVYAVGQEETILHSTGSGWTAQHSGNDVDLFTVWGSDSTHVYLAGTDENAGTGEAASSGGDGRWSVEPQSTRWRAMWGSGPADIYGLGNSTDVFHSTNAVSFDTQTSAGLNLLALWGSGAGDVYAVGDNVLYSTGNGSWTVIIGSGQWHGIWGSSSRDVYLVGVGGAILHGPP